MAKVYTTQNVEKIHGKLKKTDKGYFFVRNGGQFYRDRKETYQQFQSPKQKYNSEVFAYANSQMAQNYGTPEGKIRLEAEFKAAHRKGPNGATYKTPWSWKFAIYQFEYKQAHPFE